MIKPLDLLNRTLSNRVIVELRSNKEYRGILDGYDQHMNLVLKNAEELLEGKTTRTLEVAVVRGDSVIFISP